MDNSDFICIDAEVIISRKYIEYGLNEIENLTGMPDSNHLAFYLLSNGFEMNEKTGLIDKGSTMDT